MSERGEVSLTSVLVACTLMIVILGATLGVFEGFIAKAGDQTRRTDAQDSARTAADRIARDLRNLSSPTPEQPQAVDFASGSDLVFKTVDPNEPNSPNANTTNTKRVRYCLDPTTRQLYEQTQTWTTTAVPDPPSGGSCPGPKTSTGWSRTAVATQHVVNAAIPIFSFNSTVLTDITQIHVDLLVDTDTLRLPPATRLSTGVFLRNQNRRPTAAFSPTKTASGLVLNGSASTDDDGDPLRYVWCKGDDCVRPGQTPGPDQIGTGITFTFATPAPIRTYQLHLEVFDPAGLTSKSATQAVTA